MIRLCCALMSVAFLPALPGPASLCLLLLLLLILAVVAVAVRRLRPWLPLLVGLSWGLAYGGWGLAHRLPPAWEKLPLVAEGVVFGLPTRDGDRCRFDLALDRLAPLDPGPAPPRWMPRRLRLNGYRCARAPEPGQRLRLVVSLRRPRGYRNPGGFDYQGYLFARGIDATGYVRAPAELAEAVIGQAWGIDRWRDRLAARIGQLAGPGPATALIRALVLGDKRGIGPEQWRRLRDSGTVHLVVISGLHVGLIALALHALVNAALRLSGVGLVRRRSVAVGAALLAAGGYSLLAGFSLSTQRALVMVTALLLPLLAGRRLGVGRRCALALAAVLLFDPLAPRSVGFWLSFGATATLLYLFAGRCGPARRGTALLHAQAGIFLCLGPALLFFFYQLPLVAPLINLLAIPFISLLVLPLALGSSLALALSEPLAQSGFEATAQLLEWGMRGLQAALALAPDAWHGGGRAWYLLPGVLTGSLLLLMPRRVPGRWLAPLFWLPLLLPRGGGVEPGAYRATVVDVGQGLAVLVETAHHRLLYDTGTRYPSGFTAAEASVLPLLRWRGIDRLDRLVVSHRDQDHAGGVDLLLRQLRIDERWVTTAAGGAVGLCRAGLAWRWDGVRFRVLHPEAALAAKENDRSCVIRVDNGNRALLLTGDIEARAEAQLQAREGPALQAAVLVAPHHGSRSSSSGAFLDAVHPAQVLLSYGHLNPYGHPHPEVLARYRARGIAVRSTAEEGALTLSVPAAGAASIRGYRQQVWRYWWD